MCAAQVLLAAVF